MNYSTTLTIVGWIQGLSSGTRVIEPMVVTDRGLVPYSEWLRDPRRSPGWPFAHAS